MAPPSSGDSVAMIEPTKLHFKKCDVKSENDACLQRIAGKPYTYNAVDSGDPRFFKDGKLSSWTNAPTTLKLKDKAQVVLLKNLDVAMGLVNGARGVVVGFNGSVPVVRFRCGPTKPMDLATWTLTSDSNNNNIVLASRTQYPLDLAWATTIHKSQGMSLDCVQVQFSNYMTAGMAYVALSRCRTRQGLTITGAFSRSSIVVNKEALQYHQQCQLQKSRKKIRSNNNNSNNNN
jgi:ATP-dependent DNA helicase PIF1